MHEGIDQALIQLRSLWQYRWAALITAWLVAVSGWVWVYTLPDQYQASARVYIDSDSILRPLLRGLAVETNVEQQLKLMTRTLLSRPNVGNIMRMTDMDIKVKTPAEKERMISRLTDSIKIQKMGRERGVNLYLITYMNNERKLATAVVQSLLTILLEGSLGDKREDSDSARAFLADQIMEYESRLIAAENRLTRFKQKNVGVLPGQGGGYYQTLQGYEDARDKAMLDLREARDRRSSIRKQLEQMVATGRLSIGVNTIITSPIDKRILAMQTRLDEMLLKYTEQHPSVLELRHKILSLERRKMAENEQLPRDDSGILNNPLYQEMKLSLANEEANVAALQSRVGEYTKRIKKLEKQIETLPKIEAELTRLDRDYMINKGNYDALISRRESAHLASRVDMAGDSIKFKVIDPPWSPYAASEPKRKILNSLVLLAAIGAGLCLAFLNGQVRPAFFDRKTLHQLAGVPVWGCVSLSMSDSQISARKKQLILFSTLLLLLLATYSVVIINELKQRELLVSLLAMMGG